MAKQLGLAFLMPNEGDTYEVLKDALVTGLKTGIKLYQHQLFRRRMAGKKT